MTAVRRFDLGVWERSAFSVEGVGAWRAGRCSVGHRSAVRVQVYIAMAVERLLSMAVWWRQRTSGCRQDPPVTRLDGKVAGVPSLVDPPSLFLCGLGPVRAKRRFGYQRTAVPREVDEARRRTNSAQSAGAFGYGRARGIKALMALGQGRVLTQSSSSSSSSLWCESWLRRRRDGHGPWPLRPHASHRQRRSP